jgi:hypothetical protein
MRLLTEHPGKTIVVVALLMAVVHFTGIFVRGVRPRMVRGDAVHYYVYARSVVFDRDLDFENDYKGLYRLDFEPAGPPPGFSWDFPRTPTGLVRNYMAVGTPLAWAPLLLVVTGALKAAAMAGSPYPVDGFGLAFQMLPDVTGLAAIALALWFTFLLCRDLYGPRAAMVGALGMLVGSSLLYYGLVSPSYSHAVSAMAASGFFLYWWRSQSRTTLGRYALLGALAGATALVRWQDGVLLAVVVPDVIWHARHAGLPPRRTSWFAGIRVLVAVAAALIVFAPQMIAWQILYGQLLTVPQGGGFMRWTSPQVAAVLLSPLRGLFSWTPLALVGVVGLARLRHRDARLLWVLGGFFAVSTYVNASVADWWAGEAFGARRFMSCFPVFSVGLTALAALDGWRFRAVAAMTAVLAASNLLLLFHYEVFMLGHTSLAPYPDNWYALWVERFVLPFRLLVRSLP